MPNRSGPKGASSVGWLRLFDLIHMDGDAKLLGALFTTFDDPDADLLAENLLPRLLGIDLPSASDPRERRPALVELAEKIGRYRGQMPGITLFCTRRASEPTQHWLWRTIHRYSPNRDRSRTQHAKLWLIHRETDAGEFLDIVVSSANLTRNALNGQIQAGWHSRIPLKKTSAANSRNWTTLARFLGELGTASGDGAIAVCKHWQNVLSRAVYPSGVQFVASVPGEHNSGDGWGLHGLPKRRKGSRLRVFVPTVGKWDERSLTTFTAAAGVATNAVELLWVMKDHPWAQHWVMPPSTVKGLQESKVQLTALAVNTEGPGTCIHETHHRSDGRWSHAKLYQWDDALLITSANFSAAAWGRPMKDKNRIRIENFELGVRIDGACWPDELAGQQPSGLAAWATTEAEPETGEGTEFIDATWDGAAIKITWRPLSLPTKLPGTVIVEFEDGRMPKSAKVEWMPEDRGVQVGSLPWKDNTRPERVIGKAANAKMHFDTPVIDTRPPDEGISPVVPNELASQDIDFLALAVLEEMYGGIIAQEPVPPKNGKPHPSGTKERKDRGLSGASYAVDWHTRARERMTVLDTWSEALSGVSASGQSLVIADGWRLLKLWEGWLNVLEKDAPEPPGLRVAICEMKARLGAATKTEDA